MTGSESLLSSVDVDNVSIEALLFQTGYLSAPWKGAFFWWVRIPPNNCRSGW